MTHAEFRKNSDGFSISELSIIIAVISLIAVGYLNFFKVSGVSSDADKYAATYAKLFTLDQSIRDFIESKGRLPCPSNLALAEGRIETINFTDGGPVVGSGTYSSGDEKLQALDGEMVCLNGIGGIPTNSLGLPPDFAYDSWGHKLYFVVNPELCGPTECSPITYSQTPTSGSLTLQEPGGGSNITDVAAYIIFSQGEFGRGAYTKGGILTSSAGAIADELENLDGDTVYRSVLYNTNILSPLMIYQTKTRIADFSVPVAPLASTALVSDAVCTSNSSQLATITRAIATTAGGNLRNNIPATDIEVPSAGLTRVGDMAAIDIMWVLQEACNQYYGTLKRCPGGAVYIERYNSCQCNNGQWDGSC